MRPVNDGKPLSERIEDHALERVPAGDRHSWLEMSWGTVGIVTTLVQLFVGALIASIAGVKIALLAGLIVAVIGGFLGWGVGHVAYRSGLSSTVMARRYGFGRRGSALASAIFGFMIIGFIAVENVLLYKGFLFYFGAADTLGHRLACYAVLSLAWILLTAYGFAAVMRVSALMLVGFLGVLLYMMVGIVESSGQSWLEVATYGPQLAESRLAALGAVTEVEKLIFCINLLAGSAGALALIDADLGRYAKSSADIGIAAFLGNFALDVVMILLGAIVMYAGLPALTEYYVQVQGLAPEAARRVAVASPDRVAAAFIVFGGILGTVLMVAAQSKAQVLNTYSASLSLANICDVLLGWRPGRLAFVVLANVLSWLFLVEDFLVWFKDFLVVLGVLTMCFAGIMLADFFVVRPRLGARLAAADTEDVNWAGLLSIALALLLAHFVLAPLVRIEILTALAVSFLLYPLLRLHVLPPKIGVR